MSYTPSVTWAPGVAGGTLIRAVNLNHIEAGIVAVSQDVDSLELQVNDANSNVVELSSEVAEIRDALNKGTFGGASGGGGDTYTEVDGVITSTPSTGSGSSTGGGNGTITQVNGYPGPIIVLTKADIGLTNVNNTSDTNKPISTATQSALNAKASLDSPVFTGNVSGINKASVGLSNVDNTSDTNKPVSALQQTALSLKANLNSPTFTGTVSGITKAMIGLNNVDNVADATKFTSYGVLPRITYTGTAWPTRTLPTGYSGAVLWDSEIFIGAPSPSGMVDGDRWARKRN